jgi:hypothetical protein
MWEDEAGFIERLWMRFIELWLIRIEIEGPGRGIFEDYGSPASMLLQDFMVFPIAV